jgi:nickel-dependent lactate racemase
VAPETVHLEIPYGRSTLSADVPGPLLFDGHLEVLPEVADFAAAVLSAMEQPTGTPPLRELAAGRRDVVILVEDATRDTPVHRILPLLLDHLNAAGVADAQIEILTAPGTHRVMTDDEVRAKVGEEAYARVRISQHDCTVAESMVEMAPVHVGGVEIPVQVNRRILEADLLIGLGNILPHCSAGFSGGAKILQPGVCGFATTSATHIAATLLPEFPLGDLDSPVRAGINEVARRAGLGFIINVVRDSRGRILTVVGGDFVAAHRLGVDVSRRAYAVRVPGPADIVVVSSYPAEMDWWQGEKGVVAAWFVVKRGGVIVLASRCPEGLAHNHPLLCEWCALSYDEGCARIRACDPADVSADLIAADVGVSNAKVREHATVLVVTDGLSDEDLALLGYERQATLQQAVDRALELVPGGTIGVLPYGGDCLPMIAPA